MTRAMAAARTATSQVQRRAANRNPWFQRTGNRDVPMSVDGFVTALARADNQEPWSHGLGGRFGTATAARLVLKTLAHSAWISSERRCRCRTR